LDAGPSDAVPFSFIALCFTSGEADCPPAQPDIPRKETGEQPVPCAGGLVYIAVQPESQKEIQELFASRLRAGSTTFEIGGSAMPLAQLRMLHERGNNAD
jgi:hypothetical protein